VETRIARTRRREGIAFEVVFHAEFACDLGQRVDIVGADVARVGARVHGDAVRASIQADTRCGDDIGLAATARIAQHRDLVEIDAENGQGGMAKRLPLRLRSVATGLRCGGRSGGFGALGLGLFAQPAQLHRIDQHGFAAGAVVDALRQQTHDRDHAQAQGGEHAENHHRHRSRAQRNQEQTDGDQQK
jgi:hypothetical protein